LPQPNLREKPLSVNQLTLLGLDTGYSKAILLSVSQNSSISSVILMSLGMVVKILLHLYGTYQLLASLSSVIFPFTEGP
jgi:hypothetical protein